MMMISRSTNGAPSRCERGSITAVTDSVGKVLPGQWGRRDGGWPAMIFPDQYKRESPTKANDCKSLG